MYKLELGGGNKPRGRGFINVDKIKSPTVDVVWDLNKRPWPWPNGFVDQVYSSHCLEHLGDPHAVLREIARICRIGAAVEIRVPAAGSDMAMRWDHRHVFSVIQALNADQYFVNEYWKPPKRLVLSSTSYGPSILLKEFRQEMPRFSDVDDQTVMKWFPRTCHEVYFNYTVAEYRT